MSILFISLFIFGLFEAIGCMICLGLEVKDTSRFAFIWNMIGFGISIYIISTLLNKIYG